MAIVAHGHRVMRTMPPAIKLLAHDVAVDADPGIVGEVRSAFRRNKGEATRPDEDADGEAGEQGNGAKG